MAKTYCTWRVARLPTEGEWIKAACGTDGRKYPWGNSLDLSSVNFNSASDGYEITSPIGEFALDVSPFGVYDMAGNVSEWIDGYRYYFFVNFKADTFPIFMGGSWYRTGETNMHILQNVLSTNPSSSYVGFRCVKDATP